VKKREKLTVLPVRVADWHFSVLCRMAHSRGVGLGEVLRAILNQVFENERPTS
jgi:hypothetical protein